MTEKRPPVADKSWVTQEKPGAHVAKTERPGERPPGALVWGILVALAVALELGAIFLKNFGFTLSHVVWWAEGPQLEPRWWFVAVPIFGFLQWVAFHFLLGGTLVGGPALLRIMLAAGTVAAVGGLFTLLR